MNIIAVMIGCVCGCALYAFLERRYTDGRVKLKYCINIALKLPGETIEDFIKRAHKEQLGEYMIID